MDIVNNLIAVDRFNDIEIDQLLPTIDVYSVLFFMCLFMCSILVYDERKFRVTENLILARNFFYSDIVSYVVIIYVLLCKIDSFIVYDITNPKLVHSHVFIKFILQPITLL